jgi:hypothetical protein
VNCAWKFIGWSARWMFIECASGRGVRGSFPRWGSVNRPTGIYRETGVSSVARYRRIPKGDSRREIPAGDPASVSWSSAARCRKMLRGETRVVRAPCSKSKHQSSLQPLGLNDLYASEVPLRSGTYRLGAGSPLPEEPSVAEWFIEKFSFGSHRTVPNERMLNGSYHAPRVRRSPAMIRFICSRHGTAGA